MTTRAGDFLHRPHTARRRSSIRQALAVIPDITTLSVSFGSPIAAPNTLNNDRRSSWHPTAAATSSPDELVIQKRGRRSRTIIWSPEADSKRNSLLSYCSRDQTPEKIDSGLQSPIISRDRMPIRKRLELSNEFDESQLATPEKQIKSSNDQPQFSGNSLTNGLRGLSNDQLVKVIMDLVTMQEEGNLPEGTKIRDVVSTIMPVADIHPLRDRLNNLRQNVYGSLVSSNESAYVRAYMHLNAFQKTLMDQANTLLESQHWISLMQYVMAAWAITKDLPEWQNQDNTAQKCFSSLAHYCKQALLNGNFVRSTLDNYLQQMTNMAQDCEDMKICLQMAKELIR